MFLCKNNIGFIIQARTGSTRLPQKLLYKLNDKTFFDIVLERFSFYKNEYSIIVATTTSIKDDIICQHTLNAGFNIFRGSEDNVLDRFICCAKEFKLDYIVRICSDNLFIDFSLLNSLLEIFFADNMCHDYYSFSYKNTPAILTHFGVFCEIVSRSALEKVNEISKDKNDLEHVTYGIYNRPDLFNICLKDVTEKFEQFKGIRLTLDTHDDYINIKEIFQSIEGSWDFKNVFQTVQTKKNILDSMSYQINQQKK